MATYLRDLNAGNHSVLEANFLAARRTGQVKAQLPLGDDFQLDEPVENGVFLRYDMADKEVKKPGASNPENVAQLMLHFSVEKEYDNIRPGLNTFAIYKQGSVGTVHQGTPYPRLFQPHVGDVFTTDAIRISDSDLTGDDIQGAWDAISVGDSHPVDEDGYINCTTTTTGTGIQLTLLEKTTLPNGGEAGKFAVSVVA